MSIFHKDFNALLQKHVAQLEDLGMLSDDWSWNDRKINALRSVNQELITDLTELYVKQINEKPKDFDNVIKLLNTLQKDIEEMITQKNVSKAVQVKEKDIVNELIMNIDNRLREYAAGKDKMIRRINRLDNIVKELRKLLKEFYPDKAELFDIAYKQVNEYTTMRSISTITIHKNSDQYPAFEIFLKDKTSGKEYLIMIMFRMDIDKQVKLSDLAKEHQLYGMLEQGMERVYSEEESASDYERKEEEIFLQALRDSKDVNDTPETMYEKASKLILDNKRIDKLIQKLFPSFDSKKRAWIHKKLYQDYLLDQVTGEEIIIFICDLLVVPKLKELRKERIFPGWIWEYETTVNTDVLLYAMIARHKKYANTSTYKIQFTAYLFRKYVREGHFSRLMNHLKPQFLKEGFLP